MFDCLAPSSLIFKTNKEVVSHSYSQFYDQLKQLQTDNLKEEPIQEFIKNNLEYIKNNFSGLMKHLMNDIFNVEGASQRDDSISSELIIMLVKEIFHQISDSKEHLNLGKTLIGDFFFALFSNATKFESKSLKLLDDITNIVYRYGGNMQYPPDESTGMDHFFVPLKDKVSDVESFFDRFHLLSKISLNPFEDIELYSFIDITFFKQNEDFREKAIASMTKMFDGMNQRERPDKFIFKFFESLIDKSDLNNEDDRKLILSSIVSVITKLSVNVENDAFCVKCLHLLIKNDIGDDVLANKQSSLWNLLPPNMQQYLPLFVPIKDTVSDVEIFFDRFHLLSKIHLNPFEDIELYSFIDITFFKQNEDFREKAIASMTKMFDGMNQRERPDKFIFKFFESLIDKSDLNKEHDRKLILSSIVSVITKLSVNVENYAFCVKCLHLLIKNDIGNDVLANKQSTLWNFLPQNMQQYLPPVSEKKIFLKLIESVNEKDIYGASRYFVKNRKYLKENSILVLRWILMSDCDHFSKKTFITNIILAIGEDKSDKDKTQKNLENVLSEMSIFISYGFDSVDLLIAELLQVLHREQFDFNQPGEDGKSFFEKYNHVIMKRILEWNNGDYRAYLQFLVDMQFDFNGTDADGKLFSENYANLITKLIPQWIQGNDIFPKSFVLFIMKHSHCRGYENGKNFFHVLMSDFSMQNFVENKRYRQIYSIIFRMCPDRLIDLFSEKDADGITPLYMLFKKFFSPTVKPEEKKLLSHFLETALPSRKGHPLDSALCKLILDHRDQFIDNNLLKILIYKGYIVAETKDTEDSIVKSIPEYYRPMIPVFPEHADTSLMVELLTLFAGRDFNEMKEKIQKIPSDFLSSHSENIESLFSVIFDNEYLGQEELIHMIVLISNQFNIFTTIPDSAIKIKEMYEKYYLPKQNKRDKNILDQIMSDFFLKISNPSLIEIYNPVQMMWSCFVDLFSQKTEESLTNLALLIPVLFSFPFKEKLLSSSSNDDNENFKGFEFLISFSEDFASLLRDMELGDPDKEPIEYILEYTLNFFINNMSLMFSNINFFKQIVTYLNEHSFLEEIDEGDFLEMKPVFDFYHKLKEKDENLEPEEVQNLFTEFITDIFWTDFKLESWEKMIHSHELLEVPIETTFNNTKNSFKGSVLQRIYKKAQSDPTLDISNPRIIFESVLETFDQKKDLSEESFDDFIRIIRQLVDTPHFFDQSFSSSFYQKKILVDFCQFIKSHNDLENNEKYRDEFIRLHLNFLSQKLLKGDTLDLDNIRSKLEWILEKRSSELSFHKQIPKYIRFFMDQILHSYIKSNKKNISNVVSILIVLLGQENLSFQEESSEYQWIKEHLPQCIKVMKSADQYFTLLLLLVKNRNPKMMTDRSLLDLISQYRRKDTDSVFDIVSVLGGVVDKSA